MTTQLDDKSFIDFDPTFISQEESDEILKYLLYDIKWKTVERTLNDGTSYNLPRLQNWMADPNVDAQLYQKGPALPWSEPILKIKANLEKLYSTTFDYVLMNYYRDGNDKIGFHRDDEAETEDTSFIASVSFGATRKFKIIPRKGKKPKYNYDLSHGSLVVMRGETQLNWLHSIPSQPSILLPRINLTFRKS